MKMKPILSFSLVAFIVHLTCVWADEEMEGTMALQLEHSFDPGYKLSPSAEFLSRRLLTVRPLKAARIQLPYDVHITESQRSKLLELTRNNGLYRLRIPIKTGSRISYLATFVEACSLYESGLSDILTVHTDSTGEPVAISATTTKPRCDGATVPPSALTHFKTVVEVRPIETGPSPDTSAYIQKVDREKAEKAKGEQGDNRSFLAKYWMYIVPVFIFIFISGIANPEGQGGGGGR